jgi:glycerate kinase
LSAAEAAGAIAAGVRDAIPGAQLHVTPVADGGEGTAEVLVSNGATAVPLSASGALGRRVHGKVALRGTTGYIESAQFCGLEIEERDRTTALTATTHGVGEAIAAIAPRAGRVVVTMGGTASTDGGAGALRALGFRFLDRSGRSLGSDPRDIVRVWRVLPPDHVSAWDAVEFVVATDVSSPLNGPSGAAAVYGPQKGADTPTVAILDERLRAWSDALRRSFGRDVSETPGAGAAGGLAGGLMAALRAQVTSGAGLVLDALGVPEQIRHADLVITGEGSLDEQSYQGKVPVQIARLAREACVPVWAIVGRAAPLVSDPFDKVGQVQELRHADEDGFADAARIVRRIAARFASQWLASIAQRR